MTKHFESGQLEHTLDPTERSAINKFRLTIAVYQMQKFSHDAGPRISIQKITTPGRKKESIECSLLNILFLIEKKLGDKILKNSSETR